MYLEQISYFAALQDIVHLAITYCVVVALAVTWSKIIIELPISVYHCSLTDIFMMTSSEVMWWKSSSPLVILELCSLRSLLIRYPVSTVWFCCCPWILEKKINLVTGCGYLSVSMNIFSELSRWQPPIKILILELYGILRIIVQNWNSNSSEVMQLCYLMTSC